MTVTAMVDLGARVFVCAGPPKCDGKTPDNGPCPWCYVVEPGDKRTTEQIITDMNQQQHQ